MSVLGVSSPVLAKRHFDEGEAAEGFDRQLGGKRTRQHYSPAAGRCASFAASGLHAVPPTTVAALLALFPGMDERTVTTVLSECGNNIDAAIKRLGELRLVTADGASATGPGRAAQPLADAAASALPVHGAPAAAGGGAGGVAAGGPATAEQWVEVLVTEMSAARDMGDARNRATGFLRQFEAFVARLVRQEQAGAGPSGSAASPSGPSGPSASDPALAARASKLAEENAVLKKAVTIQHRQLQERAAVEAEVAGLRAELAAAREQARTLQVSNYSLSLHLQQATHADAMSGQHRNPDVF